MKNLHKYYNRFIDGVGISKDLCLAIDLHDYIPGFLKRSNQSPMNNYEQKRQKKDDLFAYRSKDYSETTSNASSYRSELLNHEAPSIENIIDNQILIFQKIDKLFDLVKKIESKLENKNHQFDQKTIESHVKTISAELLNNYIYPTQSEMISEATDYNKNNDGEWYCNKFENNDLKFLKWYEKILSEKIIKSTLVAKIKENIFVTFKDTLKKMINTNATPSEIIDWKNSDEVKRCFSLLDETNEKTDKSFFEEILSRTFLKHRPSLSLIAFTHAVTVLILDPETNTILIKENLIKTHMRKFMQNLKDDNCGRSGNMGDIIQIVIIDIKDKYESDTNEDQDSEEDKSQNNVTDQNNDDDKNEDDQNNEAINELEDRKI
ncbi:708_t:CDS:2, partial [Entrophospora sp. SA101]